MSKVNQVINTVLGNLTGKIPERLQSKAVLCQLIVEAHAVAHTQLAKAMMEDVDLSHFKGNSI